MKTQSERCAEEMALQDSFEADYLIGQSPVMLTIERSVCGCDYGGVSWTVKDDADKMISSLDLRAGRRLLELGAGTGWPGLYMTKVSGCDTVLSDVISAGLGIAAERAGRDGLSDRIETVVADAAAMPFTAGCFDAVSHSDILCCLKQKRAVLTECRRVIRRNGKMAFTVIYVAPDLPPTDRRRAVENGPEFVDTDTSYPDLMAQTGWQVISSTDVTPAYESSCRRMIAADEQHRDALVALIGREANDMRRENWQGKLSAIQDGLLRRTFVVATPLRPEAH